ncbi:MAG: transcriptional regulator [Rhizobiaceae bacterium]|nr:MAG: transcriptional regulator [Rhizobiaceae bacterium]
MTKNKQEKHRSTDTERPILQDYYREVGPAAIAAALICAHKKIKASAPAKAA